MTLAFILKKICFQVKFRNVATDWGNEIGNDAHDMYYKYISESRVNHYVNSGEQPEIFQGRVGFLE